MLVQVLAVGIKEVLGVLSTNSMDGCRTKPRTGSSVAPVANCNTSLRPTVPLLPPKKQFTSKMDNIFLYIKAKKIYFLRKHCGIHFFVANCVNSSLSIFLISHIQSYNLYFIHILHFYYCFKLDLYMSVRVSVFMEMAGYYTESLL